MTKVIYDPNDFSIEVRGHAGFDQAGKDIVCAAASMLTMTLENMVYDHAEALRPRVLRRKGECSIVCEPTKGNRTRCTTIYDTIYGGFELLSLNYPEYVQTLKIKGE